MQREYPSSEMLGFRSVWDLHFGGFCNICICLRTYLGRPKSKHGFHFFVSFIPYAHSPKVISHNMCNNFVPVPSFFIFFFCKEISTWHIAWTIGVQSSALWNSD